MLGHQRRAVADLATRAALARERRAVAAARLDRAKSRFLANPLNLLLPYTAGALGGALALYRKPASERGKDGEGTDGEEIRERVSWASLLSTATTLWTMSLPLRESLQRGREEALALEALERQGVPDQVGTPSPTPVPPHASAPARAPAPASPPGGEVPGAPDHRSTPPA